MPEKHIIWKRYEGATPEAEDAAFERLAKTIMHIQARLKAKSGVSQIARTFHAKPLLAVTNAHFEIAEDLAEGLRVDCFQPGVCYDTTVRFSNASGMNQPNSERDLRGAAMRLTVSDNEVHDLLMTNFPVSHARDAKQFVAFAQFGPETSDLNYLRQELGNRLAKDDVAYEFCLQRFVDERQTPIENAAVEWTESIAPPIVVARLVIPRQDLFGADADAMAREVEKLAFNPWRTTDHFRPLGNLNRARKVVYDASAVQRLGHTL